MNTCVCCGSEIPEGRMVCPSCEAKYADEDKALSGLLEED